MRKPTGRGAHFKRLLLRISNFSSYLETNISSRLGSQTEIFVARNHRIPRYHCTLFLLFHFGQKIHFIPFMHGCKITPKVALLEKRDAGMADGGTAFEVGHDKKIILLPSSWKL